jgi:hypothetical protein
VASTLRGKCGFMSSQLMGRLMRCGEFPLTQRQYWDASSSMSPRLKCALHFLRVCATRVTGRTVQFSDTPRQPLLVYTDAMYEDGKPRRMGIIVFLPNRQTIAITCFMPELPLAQLTPKATHVGQAAILAAMLLPLYCADDIRVQAVMHFVDNQSAIAGLVKCYSTKRICLCSLRPRRGNDDSSPSLFMD